MILTSGWEEKKILLHQDASGHLFLCLSMGQHSWGISQWEDVKILGPVLHRV